MQFEIQSSSWPFYEAITSTFDRVECYGFNLEDTSPYEVSSILPFSDSTIFPNHHFQYPIDHEYTLQLPSLMEGFSMDIDAFDDDPTLSLQIMGFYGYPEESEGSFLSQNLSYKGEDAWSPSSSMKSDIVQSQQLSLSLPPQEDMEMENHFSLPHLLEAIGEAREQGQSTLEHVILRRINQKVSPLGDPLERLGFKLCTNHNTTDQGNFIKQVACKNFNQLFKAFYQGLPHGKFAHFAANSVILEAIPQDSEVIEIIDFDMGEGVQWPPLIEAIAQQHKTLKLTSIKWEEAEESHWKFEETRRNLHKHAKSCGLKMKVEEKGIKELITELQKLNKMTNFMVFNCMVGLPHMGRVRSRRQVSRFLRVAKDLIKNSASTKGIIAFGDGEACEKLRNCLDFKSFFHGNLEHYHALLESIESNFPSRFSEARTTMECVFVEPYVCCEGWFQKWEDMREEFNVEEEDGLKSGSVREGILMEFGEMIRGSEGWYEIKIEGKNHNKMVLEWKKTQLVRVSTWQN